MSTEVEPKTMREDMQVMGTNMLATVQKLLHEGTVRRIIVKQGEHTIAEFPLTIGVIGVLTAPMLAAIGALSALLTNCTLQVERVELPTEEYIP